MHANSVKTGLSFYSRQLNLPAFNLNGLIVARVSVSCLVLKSFSVTTGNVSMW